MATVLGAQLGASIVSLLSIVLQLQLLLLLLMLQSSHYIEIGNVEAQLLGKPWVPIGRPLGWNQRPRNPDENSNVADAAVYGPMKRPYMGNALGRTQASMGPGRRSPPARDTHDGHSEASGHIGRTTEAPKEPAHDDDEHKTSTIEERKVADKERDKKKEEKPGSPFWDAMSRICGNFTRQTSDKKLAEGKQTRPKHYPSYAFISLKSKANGSANCSGVLVSNRHVLTVDDCPLKFDGPKNELANMTVIFGAPERTKTDEQDEEDKGAEPTSKGFRIDRVTRIEGPMCSSPQRTYSYRVIILKLFEEVEFDAQRQPACLPDDSGNEFSGDKEATLVGRYSAKKSPNNPLTRLAAFKAKKTACPDSYTGGVRLCMKPAKAKKQDGGTCEGDLGAPLLVENENKKHTVVGLLSKNSPDCEPGDKGTSGFADLSVVATTIKQFIDRSYQPRYDRSRPHHRASNRCLG